MLFEYFFKVCECIDADILCAAVTVLLLTYIIYDYLSSGFFVVVESLMFLKFLIFQQGHSINSDYITNIIISDVIIILLLLEHVL